MTMLCTLIRGQMSYTFFQLGGTCPPMSIAWGGRCPHMPFFIGGTCPGGGGGGGGGGGMSYTHSLEGAGVHEKEFKSSVARKCN